MDIRKLQRAIVDGLEDVKGQNIVVFNTEHLSPLFERVVIASGTSNRQTKALAASVRDAVKSRGFGPTRTEGEENGEWIIVDCGAAVVHLMQPGIRDYYHLEEIWGDKPVRLKLEISPPRLVKASEPEPASSRVPAKKKAAAKKAAPTKGAAKKPAARVARQPAANAEPVKKGAAKAAAAKKPAAAKGTATKAPARKVPVSKAVTRSVGVKGGTAAAPASKASRTRGAAATKRPAAATKTARRKA
jgi:ribosome-associated protein